MMTNKKYFTIPELDCLPVSECSCPSCVRMCTHSRPCWGTPKEIKNLIEMGYANRLMEDYYEGDLDGEDMPYTGIITPAITGHENKQAPFFPVGKCTFLTSENKCEIHSMKPIEGKVATHGVGNDSWKVHRSLVNIWDTNDGKYVVALWREKRKR